MATKPFVSALACLLLACACRSAPAQVGPPLLVASDLDNPPFAELDESGRPRGHDVEMMQLLLDAGADPAQQTDGKTSALMAAAGVNRKLSESPVTERTINMAAIHKEQALRAAPPIPLAITTAVAAFSGCTGSGMRK
jgi:hypothetical protein